MSVLFSKYLHNQSFDPYLETKLHKIVNINQNYFCKDPSTHPCARDITVRAHVLSLMCVFTPRVRACVHESLQFFWGYCFLSYEIKFKFL